MSGAAAVRLVLGHLVSFSTRAGENGKRGAAGEPGYVLNHYRKGALVVGEDGRIIWRGHHARLPLKYAALPADDFGDALVLPGFVDLHIHFPQYRMLAAPGKDLLDWLARFTFAEEARYGVRAHASAAAEIFLDRLLANGTTTAVAYCSVHEVSADALFEAAAARRMCIFAGKTMMDRNAPAKVLDTAAGGVKASARLLERWHGQDRLRYAITLRFAVTSTEAQLQATGELLASNPDCVFQTHLSESPAEIQFVRQQFPWARDYTDVYDRYGLLRPRSLFGHGIHLSARERRRLSKSGSTVVHCPTSNTFLGSGLFQLNKFADGPAPVSVGVATDIGGGTSYSMLHTLGEAHKVAMLSNSTLGVYEAFYMATLGNAKQIGMDAEIGSLEAGKWADLVVLDPHATELLSAREALSVSISDTLFSLMILGDDRAVRATYVAGRRY